MGALGDCEVSMEIRDVREATRARSGCARSVVGAIEGTMSWRTVRGSASPMNSRFATVHRREPLVCRHLSPGPNLKPRSVTSSPCRLRLGVHSSRSAAYPPRCFEKLLRRHRLTQWLGIHVISMAGIAKKRSDKLSRSRSRPAPGAQIRHPCSRVTRQMQTLSLQCIHAGFLEHRGGRIFHPVWVVYPTGFCPDPMVTARRVALAVASLQWTTRRGLRGRTRSGDSCETPVLGSHQYPAVFWSGRCPHDGLCVNEKHVGARPRGNTDPGRRCLQCGWIRRPGGSGNGHLGWPLVCASPKGSSYT
jgi:hypothetical protein